MAKSKLVQANKKIEKAAVAGYGKIEKNVVGSYKKMEVGVVKYFNKMVDAFVDHYLTKEGETVKEARERMSGK